MKQLPVRVTFDNDTEYGLVSFNQRFQDSESALAYLGGYLGEEENRISNFVVDFLWEEGNDVAR
jgi:hypothetical protein